MRMVWESFHCGIVSSNIARLLIGESFDLENAGRPVLYEEF